MDLYPGEKDTCREILLKHRFIKNECTIVQNSHKLAAEVGWVVSRTKVNFLFGFLLSLYFNKGKVDHDLFLNK